ncbi:MAG TPA: glycosyltransferase family 4 protein, partial [Solirubrobacterales bacterium]|nr:glycosyltransferase family 4 protein [Solirubrobacterales bacterium]
MPVPRAAGRTVGEFVERVTEELKGRGHEVRLVSAAAGMKRLLASAPPDVVHVHEPFAPSASSSALRHSFSLNVATFHAPRERVLSTLVARPLVEILFGRIDARTAASPAARDLMERYFPGRYELVEPA